MNLADVLERVDAPEELLREVRDDELDLDRAWARCRRADHRIWLAACAGAPIDTLIEASAAAVLALAERIGEGTHEVVEAVELAVAGAGIGELSVVAERCEALAETATGDYRTAPAAPLGAAARAAALVVRAAEGLAEGEARREAPRLERARQLATLMGGGTQAFLPGSEGPARLDPLGAATDPGQGAFLFAVAACAESAAEGAATLAGPAADPDALARAHAELDALVREVLEGGRE